MNAVDGGGTHRFCFSKTLGGGGLAFAQFNYLSILISLIIGLAIAQVLTGIGRLIQARARVVFFWPSVLWAALFQVILIETWWSMFRLRSDQTWNFFSFLVITAHPIGLFMICSLILPDPSEFGGARPVDLHANYLDHRVWFYGLIIFVSLARLVRPFVAVDAPLTPLDITVQVMIILAAGVGALSTRDIIHRALPVLACVLLGTYYALVYIRLV
jgi:hypothetical protein